MPLRSYDGPILPGTADPRLPPAQRPPAPPVVVSPQAWAEAVEEALGPDEGSDTLAALGGVPTGPPPVVDALEAPEPLVRAMALTLFEFPDRSFRAELQADSGQQVRGSSLNSAGEAVEDAFAALWLQLDKPRCPTCGQYLPESDE